MGNRALAVKAERAKRQSMALAQVEFAKPFYAGNGTLAAANAKRVALAAIIDASPNKPFTRYETTPAPMPEGKGKRRFVASCHGNGTRRTHGAAEFYDLWAAPGEQRLIPAK